MREVGSYEALSLPIELAALYAEHTYGQYHAQQPLRYEPMFGSYGREAMLWDFGPDIHPVTHMSHTAGLMLEIEAGEPDGLDWPLKAKLVDLSGCVMHDIGECTDPVLVDKCGRVIGDIPYGCKTDEDRAQEAKIRGVIYLDVFPDLPEGIKAGMEDLITHRSKSLGSELFRAAHLLGFLRTGLRAQRLALEAQTDGPSPRSIQHAHMGRVVVDAIMPTIGNYYNRFRVIRREIDQANYDFDGPSGEAELAVASGTLK